MESESKSLALKFFIELANECLALNDLLGMGAILSGLNNSFIQTLRDDWNELDKESKKKFGKMDELLGANLNYSSYRKYLEEMESKEEPYLPYLPIHLRDIVSTQELIEKSKQISSNLLHLFENGKKIWKIMRAQKRIFKIEKKEEIYKYLMNSSYLLSEATFNFDSSNQKTSSSSSSSPQLLPKVAKNKVRTTSIPINLYRKQQKKSVDQQATICATIRERKLSKFDHLQKFQKNNSQRNHLYKLNEKDILKKKEFSIPENLEKWKLWNVLKILFVYEDTEFQEIFQEIRKNYFSSEQTNVKLKKLKKKTLKKKLKKLKKLKIKNKKLKIKKL